MEKIPEEELPAVTGVFETDHVKPRSLEWKTRAAAPPVAIHTLSVPATVMLLPLAAKAASPGSAGGILARDVSFQVMPPSVVRMIKKRPSTGSLNAIPLLASQNAKPSKNAFGS